MGKKKEPPTEVPTAILKAAWIAGTTARQKFAGMQNPPAPESMWNDESLYAMDAAALVILEWADRSRKAGKK